MKKILIIILTIVSLVALASCNIPIPEPPVPDEIKDVLDQEPTIDAETAIDKILNKEFRIKEGGQIAINDVLTESFVITKDTNNNYIITGYDGSSMQIEIRDDRYYFINTEMIIDTEEKTIKFGNKVYGTTE